MKRKQRSLSFPMLMFVALLGVSSTDGIAQTENAPHAASTAASVAATTPSAATNRANRRGRIVSDGGVAPVTPDTAEHFAMNRLLTPQIVRNQSLAAEFIAETVYPTADGKRLTRTSTIVVQRDRFGRLRLEHTFRDAPSPDGVAAEPVRSITVVDPLLGYRYSLVAATRTAHRLPLPPAHLQSAPFAERTPSSVDIERGDNAAGTTLSRYRLEAARTEALGKQFFLGVEAEGERTVTRIPGNALGNPTAFEVVSEKWIARDLDLLVQSTVRNSWNGDYTVRLTRLSRLEPLPDLFLVPVGYQVVEAGVRVPGLLPPIQ